MSQIHARPEHDPAAAARLGRFHPDVVAEVQQLIRDHDVVIVGMGWNPHVRRARRALDAAGVVHQYLEIGNYAARWKPRLAVKLWSGWPTFPQVFVKHSLLGGADELDAALQSGALQERLAPTDR